MQYSKQFIENLSKKRSFIKDNFEKVLRLSVILKHFNQDSAFKDLFALKGGTAINLLVQNLPRLSYDIDVDLTMNLNKDEIAEIKPKIKESLIEYMKGKGYSLPEPPREHYTLLSFVFAYINNAGNNDSIKIDINTGDRCHILPLEKKRVLPEDLIESFDVLTLNTVELYASKINALITRATPRDLYDVNAMINSNIISPKDKTLLMKCIIFYDMIGGEQSIDKLDYDNISNIDFNKIKRQLKPLLSKDERFDLEKAKTNVIAFLKEFISIDKEEKKFIDEFRKKNYRPELLFNDKEIINNIKSHPMALWRCKE